MGIGISVFLLAAGAILWLAVSADISGVSVDAIGIILMIVGTIGLLWSLLTAGAMTTGRHERVVEHH